VSLPGIGTAQNVNKAAEKVMQGIGRGKITAIRGEKMMNVLQMRSRIIDSVEMESRIETLEESMAASSLRNWRLRCVRSPPTSSMDLPTGSTNPTPRNIIGNADTIDRNIQ
jgi:hypothetical protein